MHDCVSGESYTGSKVTIQKGRFSICLQPQCICKCTPTALLVHFVMFHFLENRYRKFLFVLVCFGSAETPTGWSHSTTSQLLTYMYLPKRIHFHIKTFEMRMNLAVMDWVSSLVEIILYRTMQTPYGWLQSTRISRCSPTITSFQTYWWPKHFGLYTISTHDP